PYPQSIFFGRPEIASPLPRINARLLFGYGRFADGNRTTRRTHLRFGRSTSGIAFQQSRFLSTNDGALNARRAFQGATIPLRRCLGVAQPRHRYRPASRRLFRGYAQRLRAVDSNRSPRGENPAVDQRTASALERFRNGAPVYRRTQSRGRNENAP